MIPSWWMPCLLLLTPVVCKIKTTKTQLPAPLTTPIPTQPTTATTAATSAPADQELDLPSPSLLRSLYDTTVAVFENPWSDSEAASRQGDGGGMNNGVMRMTVGTFFAALLATILGVVGFGSVGLLAAKALAVGTLALFLNALAAIKKPKEDNGGQTVHYVPIQHGYHHDFFHERSDPILPYLDRNV